MKKIVVFLTFLLASCVSAPIPPDFCIEGGEGWHIASKAAVCH